MSERRETVLQWNMDFSARTKPSDDVQRSRLAALDALLAKHSPSIVALQEAPTDHRLKRILDPRYDIFQSPKGIVTALSKTRWRMIEKHEAARKRALVLKIDSGDQRLRLWLWNVHVPRAYKDRGSRQEFVRTRVGDRLRDFRINDDSNRSELLLGDFNLAPYDDALMRHGGINARSSPHWAARGRLRETRYRRLFNPTWSLLGRVQPPHGTFYYDKDLDGDGPWFALDQAIMSPRLALVGKRQMRIVEHAGGKDLHDGSEERRPDREVGSDHFPLLIRFRAE